MQPKGIKARFVNLSGLAIQPISIRQVLGYDLRDGIRMHLVKKITAHKAIPAATVDVHAAAAGHNYLCSISVDIKESFQEQLPPRVLVQFIE